MDDANPFGRCCEDLRQAMHKKEHSMFGVENGILFLNIGIVQMTSQTGYFMKPVRFCPFCGIELQSAENLADWGKRR